MTEINDPGPISPGGFLPGNVAKNITETWEKTTDLRFLYGKLQQREQDRFTGRSRWMTVPAVLEPTKDAI